MIFGDNSITPLYLLWSNKEFSSIEWLDITKSEGAGSIQEWGPSIKNEENLDSTLESVAVLS